MLLQLLAAAIGKGTVPVITLSGGTFVHTVTDPSNAQSGIRLQAGGGMQEQEAGSFIGRSTATDWIIPNGAASADYDCRVTSVVGDAFDNAAAADDVWINCGSDRTWNTLQSTVGNKLTTFNFEIRDPEGVTVASTEYSINSIVDSGG